MGSSLVPPVLAALGPATILTSVLALLLLVAGVAWFRASLRAERQRTDSLERHVEQRREVEDLLRRALEREQEAAESFRMLDEIKNGFLQAVSHELRTPLTAVLGNAMTLKNDAERGGIGLLRSEREELLDRVVSSANKLDRLLSDLLDLDRLGRGIIAPQRQPTDVASLARRVAAETDLGGRAVETAPGSVTADVDAAKVERIVENLLINAIRHTPPESRVWVRVEATDEGMTIVVEDDGPGVPDELKGTLFEPFRQGTVAGGAGHGAGIGLSLVARFAELHGGRAWVEDREGGGASFQVLLPDEGSGAARGQGRQPPVSASRVRSPDRRSSGRTSRDVIA